MYTDTCKLVPTSFDLTLTMFEFTVTSAVQGFHVYKSSWENCVPDEELNYQVEVENLHDPLVVPVVKLIDGEGNNYRVRSLMNIYH